VIDLTNTSTSTWSLRVREVAHRVSKGTRRRSRRVIVAAVLLAATLFLAPRALTHLGTWLVVADPLQPARSIVVLGGHVPFRATEAAALYKHGWAHEVWLTQGWIHEEDRALGRLGIERTPEHGYSRLVLLRSGVPEDAIRLLDGRNLNTADEVRTVVRALEEAGGGSVILITSKSHSRRVKVIWRALAGGRLGGIVRYTPQDPFEPDRWWTTTADAMAVSREWGALLNAWAGFPVSSQRRRRD
jgi:uncharacterized SAM-binding protein YcdF (DUF218 family)